MGQQLEVGSAAIFPHELVAPIGSRASSTGGAHEDTYKKSVTDSSRNPVTPRLTVALTTIR